MSMNKITKKYVSFKRLEFTSEQYFFEFNDKRTIIVGGNGTGKSTLVSYLSSLGCTDDSKINYSVLTEGDRLLIHKYSNLIFINYEHGLHMERDLLHEYVDSALNIEYEVSLVMNELFIEKPWNVGKCNILNINTLPLGERVCLTYAYTFAIRNLINMTLPLVLDNPFGLLDIELRIGLSQYLNRDDSQQILLLNSSEYDDSLQLGNIDYTLNGFSHV